MHKDKDVIKNEEQSKKDLEKKISSISDSDESTAQIPEPLNKALEDAVEKHPNGMLGCGG